jgi:hypothetical protein
MVIGILIAIPSVYFYNLAGIRVQECQTFLGQVGQGLDSNTAEHCNAVSSLQSESLGGIVLGLILFITSLVGVTLVKRDDRRKQLLTGERW